MHKWSLLVIGKTRRYQELCQHIDQVAAAFKEMPKHRRQDEHHVEMKLKVAVDLFCVLIRFCPLRMLAQSSRFLHVQGLLQWHHGSAADRLHAAAKRQQLLAESEMLASQLEGIVPLSQLQNPCIDDFARPPKGTGRWVRASLSGAGGGYASMLLAILL